MVIVDFGCDRTVADHERKRAVLREFPQYPAAQLSSVKRSVFCDHHRLPRLLPAGKGVAGNLNLWNVPMRRGCVAVSAARYSKTARCYRWEPKLPAAGPR